MAKNLIIVFEDEKLGKRDFCNKRIL